MPSADSEHPQEDDYDENQKANDYENILSTLPKLDELILDSEEEEHEHSRRKRQTISESPHPLEVGIIHTKYGTIATGPLLMGIAAGSESQSAKVFTPIKENLSTNSERFCLVEGHHQDTFFRTLRRINGKDR